MISRKLLALCFLCLIHGCHHNDRNYTGIILIDANKKYPSLALKLSDITEISYIPLKSDNIIFGYTSASRALFVYRDKIFIGDKISADPKLLVYDRNGTPIQTFGSYGRGPGEYMSINGFVVDTLANEVTLYDNTQKKLIVYDIDGKFRRERSLWQIKQEQDMLTDIEIINDDYILVFNRNSLLVAERMEGRLMSTGKTMMIIDKQTLSEIPFHGVEYANAGYSSNVTVRNNLTTIDKGVYITSERSDTIFFMNRNLEITPRFRDITDYKSNFKARLFPSMETERYVLFSTEKEAGTKTLEHPNPIPRKFFAYDKKKQLLFRLNDDLPEQDKEYNRAMNTIIKDKVALDQSFLTLNHDYAATLLSPVFLLKYYMQLPKELKEVVKDIKEDDNPVVALYKFK